MDGTDSRSMKVSGLTLAGVGIGHLIAPAAFDKITAPAFPTNTRRCM